MVDRKFGVIRFALISGQPSDPTRRYDRAVPFWTWIPLVILLVLLLLLGSIVVLGRVRNGRYLRPVVAFLSKVPLFKRWFQEASIAALERQNPELAGAMKKIQAFGEPKTPEQAQRMLNLLTPSERRAYMAAVGEENQMPDATNRQLRRKMEHGGAGMPVSTKQVSQRPGASGRKAGKNAKKKR
jgi:hypothetical protein